MRYLKLLALAAVVAALGAVAAPSALADYGRGAQYQIELSANNVGQVPGDGVWLWVALNRDTTGDYEATDCIHTGPVGPNGALHESGDVSWSDDGTNLTITGIRLLGGLVPVTIVVPDRYGHYVNASDAYIHVAPNPIVPGIGGTAQLQVAP